MPGDGTRRKLRAVERFDVIRQLLRIDLALRRWQLIGKPFQIKAIRRNGMRRQSLFHAAKVEK